MTRSEILDHAKALVTKDREATHGQPERNLGLIAALWSAYLEREVTPVDVTMLMVLLKAARIKGNPVHIDSFTDICGYASLGGEMSAPMQVKITPERVLFELSLHAAGYNDDEWSFDAKSQVYRPRGIHDRWLGWLASATESRA